MNDFIYPRLQSCLPVDEAKGLVSEATALCLLNEHSLMQCQCQSPQVYWLEQGALRIWAEDNKGTPITLNFAAPGEFIGEMNALDGLGHSANVTAIGDCQLLRIGCEQFRALMDCLPGLASLVARQQGWRLRVLSRHFLALSDQRVEQRVARQLLLLSARFPGSEGAIGLRLSQDDIAQFVSASRPPVNQAINRFRKADWIISEPQKRFIAVCERVKLADFCLGHWHNDLEARAIYGLPDVLCKAMPFGVAPRDLK